MKPIYSLDFTTFFPFFFASDRCASACRAPKFLCRKPTRSHRPTRGKKEREREREGRERSAARRSRSDSRSRRTGRETDGQTDREREREGARGGDGDGGVAWVGLRWSWLDPVGTWTKGCLGLLATAATAAAAAFDASRDCCCCGQCGCNTGQPAPAFTCRLHALPPQLLGRFLQPPSSGSFLRLPLLSAG